MKDQEVEEPVPDAPTDLPKRSWLGVLKGSLREFQDDNLTDTAAALTYYTALAIFPALLVLVSLVGLAGQDTTQQLVDNLGQVVPGSARDILSNAIASLQRTPGAGLTALAGLLGAIWSASGYVGAFMRAANNVYDVPEGRPFWKTIPVRLAVTIVLLLMMAVCSIIVVFTGPIAQQAGDLLGLGSVAVTVWSIAKWPVLLVLLMMMIAILYWACPNAKQPGFKWVTPGGIVGVLIWLIASVGFGFYVANFGSYNKTYGALAGVIVFLVWIWISNLAILLGAELNAELDRARADVEPTLDGRLVAGLLVVPVAEVLQVPDDRRRRWAGVRGAPLHGGAHHVVRAGVVEDQDLLDPGPEVDRDAIQHGGEGRLAL